MGFIRLVDGASSSLLNVNVCSSGVKTGHIHQNPREVESHVDGLN